MTVRRVAESGLLTACLILPPAAINHQADVAAFGRRPTPSSPTSTAANGCGTGSSTRGGGAS
jgi:hypothetical protein